MKSSHLLIVAKRQSSFAGKKRPRAGLPRIIATARNVIAAVTVVDIIVLLE
jgi:hypothetical protein